MRFCRANTHRTASHPHSLRTGSATLILTLLISFATTVRAQAPSPPPLPDGSAYTLHVYTDLVQIPTLVLSQRLYPLPPIPRDDFDIRLDSGPPFHPTHMRIEGDDPIDLAILLDLSGPASGLQSAIRSSIAAFITNSLKPRDHVSIYASDCILLRTEYNVQATDGEEAEDAVDRAISDPGIHGHGETSPGCAKANHLWNDLAAIAEAMPTTRRRQVILVVSTGVDRKSPIKWQTLKHYAASRSIAIFGLYPEPEIPNQSYHRLDTENPFNQLCQLTGGMILYTSSPRVSDALDYFISLLRSRYILEFPRPDKGSAGQHDIEVTLSDTVAFVRPSGVAVPLPDPAILSDPTTIPSAPSPAVYGKRPPMHPYP